MNSGSKIYAHAYNKITKNAHVNTKKEFSQLDIGLHLEFW